MAHPFCPGYQNEPFRSLASEYPEADVFPGDSSGSSGGRSFTAAGWMERHVCWSSARTLLSTRPWSAASWSGRPAGGFRGCWRSSGSLGAM